MDRRCRNKQVTGTKIDESEGCTSVAKIDLVVLVDLSVTIMPGDDTYIHDRIVLWSVHATEG